MATSTYIGGYALVDCEGLNLLADAPQTISGLYKRLQKVMKTGKQVIATNIKWGTLPITPIPAFCIQLEADKVYCTSSTLQVIVSSADVVTVNNMIN